MRSTVLIRWLSIGVATLGVGCGVAAEDVEGLQQGLPKPFGINGDGDYCNDPANLCVGGEGDCDTHAQCATDYCGRDNGAKFGLAPGADVCVPAHCQNKVWDGDELATDCGGSCGSNCNTVPCSEPNGHLDKCTDRCLCASGEGDCDGTEGCQSGLICGRDNGPKFGFVAGSDVCVPAHCQNKVWDGDELATDCGGSCGSNCNTPPCSEPNGHLDKCTDRCPCASGEGDCDGAEGCRAGLVCGQDNGPKFGFAAGSDVCIPAHCKNKRLDSDETQVDCGGACGSVCPVERCLTEGAHWYIDITGTFSEQWPEYDGGSCVTVWSGSYQRRLDATVVNGAVQVTEVAGGVGFEGTYQVVEETNSSFTAEAGSLFGPPYTCGYAFPEEYGSTGFVTMTFDCITGRVSFEATCNSEISGDGCPNYHETATGSGGTVSCAAGYVPLGGECVDIDECSLGSCSGAETCTNLPGSYVCSCDAPAGLCAVGCVNLASDPANCGTCANTCELNQICQNGTCSRGPWIAVDAGSSHSCGQRTDGGIACWGNLTTTPNGTFSSVGAGRDFSCALTTAGAVTCWGTNSDGQTTVPAGTFSSVSAGARHSCGLRTDGSIVCWGSNSFGQAAAPSGTFTSVSAGALHTCGVRNDGRVACWGWNDYGQGSIPSGTFTSVSAGSTHTCALRTDQTITCWGAGGFGEATPPSGTFSSVSAGLYHTCGVRSEGTLACWGADGANYGQAAAPSGAFVSVSAGDYHSCGVATNGTVQCWGCGSGTGPLQCIPPDAT